MITISDKNLRIGRRLIAVLFIFVGVQVATAALENKKLSGTMQPLGNVSQHKISPDSRYVVYTADQDTDGAVELFSAPIDGSSPAVRISELLPTGSSVRSFTISADSQRVVYIADQDTFDVDELYSVPITGGTPVKLNGLLVLNGTVSTFVISPDGKRVVYRATQDDDDAYELYLVKIDGGAVTKMNQPLPPKGMVSSFFRISADSEYLVYMADQDTLFITELYSVSLKTGTTEKLNGPLVTDGEVRSFQITPDSKRVVYSADQDIEDEAELFVTPIDGGAINQLNDPLPTGGDIDTFQLSPDGDTVIYGGYQDSLAFRELFSVPLVGGSVQKLNGTLQQEFGVDIIDFKMTPDSQFIVFGADQTDSPNGIFELYSNSLNGGSLTKLSGAVVPGGFVEYDAIAISPDSQYVVYEGAQQTVGVVELYSAPVAGGSVVKLNGSLAATGGDISSFQIRPDSSGVAYRANQDESDVFELYAASFSSPDIIKLHAPLVTDGDIVSHRFYFSADGASLVYLADQETDGINELFVTYNNERPSFTSTPVKIAKAEEAYAYDVSATDPNGTGTLLITAVIKPSWLNFSDDGDGQARLRAQPTAAEVGQHLVSLQVIDTDGLTSLQTFSIMVEPENILPTFLTFPVNKVAVGAKYFYAISAEDPDTSDLVTLAATTKPDWATFADNGDGTALLTGQPESADLGKHNVMIELTDSDGAKVIQKFRITVKEPNQKPAFTTSPILSAIEGEEYSYSITASDADLSDSLTISAPVKPAWLALTDQGNGQAILTGTPSMQDVGVHAVQLEVVDSKSEIDIQTFEIEVQPSDSALAFSSAPTTVGKEGDEYRFEATTDYSGDAQDLVISAPTAPTWLTFVDNGDGTALLSGTPALADVGNHSVELFVTDGQGLNDTLTFLITVEAKDSSEPEITDFVIHLPLVVSAQE